MEIALGILAGLVVLMVAAGTSFMFTILIGIVKDMKEILTLTQVNTGKISGIDSLLVAVHTYFVQDMMDRQSPDVQAERIPTAGWEEMQIAKEDGKYITEDGIHSASSFEELIGKITKDPRYRVNRPEDIEEIRQRFDEFNEMHDGDEGFGDEFDGDHGMGPPEGPEGPVPGDEWKDSA